MRSRRKGSAYEYLIILFTNLQAVGVVSTLLQINTKFLMNLLDKANFDYLSFLKLYNP